MSPRRGRRRRLARYASLGLLAAAALVGLQDWRARPSLVGFDPPRMGRLEASMWRSYYDHRWGSLALDGLRVSCGQYGFSWWDGARASVLAARAALHFRGGTEDPRCLPLLERYYAILADALGAEFDVAEAARLELEWWRERRRGMGPTEYAGTIAANVAEVYGLPPAALLEASRLRAEAMDYRDRHGRGRRMGEEHWDEVGLRLEQAYRELRRVAAAPMPAPAEPGGTPSARTGHWDRPQAGLGVGLR